MSIIAGSQITAEALWQMPDNGMRRELIDGEVVEAMPPGGIHGAISVVLATLLRAWAQQYQPGYVGVEAGYILARDPDSVRGPDVSYVRGSRIPAGGIPEGFWAIAPDLAVEIVSPSESAEGVREKIRDFLLAGTAQVWVVYPRTRELVIHLPSGLAHKLSSADTISVPDLLPTFRCTVAELFLS